MQEQQNSKTALVILISAFLICLVLVLNYRSVNTSYIVNDPLDTDTNLTRPIDYVSQSVMTVDFAHHESHEGNHYYIADYEDIEAGTNMLHLLVVQSNSSGERSHFIFEIEHSFEYRVTITEDVIVTDNGTQMVGVNRDRNSLNTAGMLVFDNPTVIPIGTVIYRSHKGDGKKSGGIVRESAEIILMSDVSYLINITNEGQGESMVNYFYDWYEHIDGAYS